MIPIKQVIRSTVGRKFVMALTGMALVGFIILHLLGNLQLLIPGARGAELFNDYGAKFKSLGPLYYVLEWGLFGVIALHAVLGAVLWKKSSDARDTRYALAETKGGDSRWNLSSGHMMLLGAVLGLFIVVHVLQFRYQLFSAQRYETLLDGKPVEDLHRLVLDTFQSPLWVAFYMGTMLFLGLHLRHGIWSMFQSIGAMPAAYSNLVYALAAVAAMALALGFFFLPLYLYLIQRMP